ncbi:RND transporter [Vibrio sp. HA2012]|uniref:efflux RND transporter permease subunit n=1 Tax=Vibrio sp. HA2012 TaxID=1971595 RepID=UPI000C2C041A|nr:efflux RND transporter permease subunit [Vibrio sp. HA2012]PJC87267.1 RND transporter [Vibrio sp. HA2012]
MNISAWSIRNPIPVVLLFAILSVAGLLAFNQMKVQDLPDIELPEIIIATTLEGASPEQLETDITKHIEGALSSVQGVRHIFSSLNKGEVSIAVEFYLERDLQEALNDVKDAILTIRPKLPANISEPIIRKKIQADDPILRYAVLSPTLSDNEISWYIDDVVAKKILGGKGVGSFKRIGGTDREIRITLRPAALIALKTTAGEISRAIASLISDTSGGQIQINGIQQSIKTGASITDIRGVENLSIPLSDGQHVRLSDIAEIQDTFSNPSSSAYLDGKEVVVFEVSRAVGFGEIDVAQVVRRAIADLDGQYPHISIVEVMDHVSPVEESFVSSVELFYEGAFLAVVVIFLFLRNWRSTVLATIALPLSVIPTFICMQYMGFTLNMVTLLSLSLVIGVLVDDSIVEIENIERHLAMGKSPRKAAEDAANEIGLAVVATTFSLIAVFLPTAFMQGIVGRFFVQFGWTCAIAVFFSLLVARFLTPMIAAYLLRPVSMIYPVSSRWLEQYIVVVAWCLNHRRITLSVATILPVFGLWIATNLPMTFIPPEDNDFTTVTIFLPEGSELGDTAVVVTQAQRILRENKYVLKIMSIIGNDSGESQNIARLTVDIPPRNARLGIDKKAIEQEIRDELSILSGVKVKVGSDSDRENYTLVLASNNVRLLQEYAIRVEKELRLISGVGTVTSDLVDNGQELHIVPDVTAIAEYGISMTEVSDTLRITTVGDYLKNLANLNMRGRQIPVVVRLSDHDRSDLDILRHLPVAGKNGSIALGNIVDTRLQSSTAAINRFDQMRNITFNIEMKSLTLGELESRLDQLPILQSMPQDIILASLGDAEMMMELSHNFTLVLAIGLLCIYSVLVLLFRGFAQPVIILFSLVLSIPGAFFLLYVTHTAVSLPAMIGLVMLMGIATKNAILMVDYINLAKQGSPIATQQMIIEGCRKRVRPIVMTSIAMGAGMLPLALGLNGDPSFRSPMGIVVIGGLMSSTFLSLFVIPVVFSYVDSIGKTKIVSLMQ